MRQRKQQSVGQEIIFPDPIVKRKMIGSKGLTIMRLKTEENEAKPSFKGIKWIWHEKCFQN